MYIVYGKKLCPYCVSAVKLLQSKGCDFTYHSMDKKLEELTVLAMHHNQKTVPIILQLVEEQLIFIGGYDNLCAWLNTDTIH
tara:strand:+ start:338 stop:583 length:246 start_codon:yes stop_codon:yes gene_type:complete